MAKGAPPIQSAVPGVAWKGTRASGIHPRCLGIGQRSGVAPGGDAAAHGALGDVDVLLEEQLDVAAAVVERVVVGGAVGDDIAGPGQGVERDVDVLAPEPRASSWSWKATISLRAPKSRMVLPSHTALSALAPAQWLRSSRFTFSPSSTAHTRVTPDCATPRLHKRQSEER